MVTYSPLKGPAAGKAAYAWGAAAVALIYAAYYVLRYGGLWTENDSAVFTASAFQTARTGSVIFPGQYSHGPAYPGWLASIHLLTGMPTDVVNAALLPFIGALLLALTALLAYRVLLVSDSAALAAFLLLLATPDLMFSVLRGNHEKLDIALMLSAIYALSRGFAAMRARQSGALSAWVGVFYVLTLVNALTNDYFASTLVLATTLTLGVAIGLARAGGRSSTLTDGTLTRLALAVAASWLIVWWVILYLFPPAAVDLRLLATTGDKLRSLFLTLQPSSNPYLVPTQEWNGPIPPIFLTAFRWILFAGSFAAWLVISWSLLRRRLALTEARLFLVALYGAFGLLIAVSIPVDYTGLYAGTNLELRNFAYFALIASPLLASGTQRAARWAETWAAARPSLHRLAERHRIDRLLAAPVAFFIVVGLPKVTLDPAVSNIWTNFSQAELQILKMEPSRAGGSSTWVGPDDRLVYAALCCGRQSTLLDSGRLPLDGPPHNYLRSPQLVASADALRAALPGYAYQDRTMDVGAAQLFHQVPASPYQG